MLFGLFGQKRRLFGRHALADHGLLLFGNLLVDLFGDFLPGGLTHFGARLALIILPDATVGRIDFFLIQGDVNHVFQQPAG